MAKTGFDILSATRFNHGDTHMYPEKSTHFFTGCSFFFVEHLAIMNDVEHLLQNLGHYVTMSSVTHLSVLLEMFFQQGSFFLGPTPLQPMVLALIGNGVRCFRGFRMSTRIGIIVVGKEDVDRRTLRVSSATIIRNVL